MKKTALRWFVFMMVSSSILLAACGSSPAAGDGPGSLEIKDTTGHTVTLDGLPQEIAIAGKASVMVQDAAFMFDEADQRVKALENRNQSVFDFLPVVDPTIDEKDLFERDAGPEQIAAVKPDLVLMKNFNKNKLGDSVEKLGIPVLYLNLETPDVFYQDIQMLGKVFGVPERAEEIIRFYKDRVEKVQEITADLEEGEKPRVLILRYSDQGGDFAFSVPPESWLQTQMVEIAGGRPVWVDQGGSGGWSIVNFEQIAAWDPDQIYLVDYKGDADEVVRRLKEDALWGSLSALKEGQLYAFAFDFYSWDQPDTRWVLGLEWLATKIHPERADGIDILAEVDAFYDVLYRLDQESIQEDVLPKLRGDIP
ncbi:MAG: ABC transporter substrate-binding protein [Anaerolineales bacterium]|nr:ABC transporter substrate-binding protein [Anaerolineales bacterium]